MSDHFDNDTYHRDGKLALTGSAQFTSPIPQNDDSAGNLGCVPESHSCTVQFWFDSAPCNARTSIDISTLLATGSVIVPIRGTATNVASDGETRSGHFRWSGTLTLRAVRTGPWAPVPGPNLPVARDPAHSLDRALMSFQTLLKSLGRLPIGSSVVVVQNCR